MTSLYEEAARIYGTAHSMKAKAKTLMDANINHGEITTDRLGDLVEILEDIIKDCEEVMENE